MVQESARWTVSSLLNCLDGDTVTVSGASLVRQNIFEMNGTKDKEFISIKTTTANTTLTVSGSDLGLC